MAYTKDRPNTHCKRCRKKVRLVRCPSCKGRGGGWLTQCATCANTGYVCENGGTDRYHRW